MKILAFDTSTPTCTVAVMVDQAAFQVSEMAVRKHTDLLLPMIKDLLCQSSLSLSELDAIAFGCGPGSFMGVRLAAAVAQGLAFAAQKPVISISTLQCVAQTAYEKYAMQKVIVALDARMQQIYWAAFALGPQSIMLPIAEEHLNNPEEVDVPKGDDWAKIGNGWLANTSFMSEIYPDARSMLAIAERKYQEGDVLAVEEVQPVYLRNQVTQR